MDNVTPLPLNHLPPVRLDSNITYELEQAQDPHQGYIVPLLLGQGRFAKVYAAWQRSSDRNVRRVAIKILHEHVDRRAEDLSLQEIKLLKDVTATANENVIHTIDIIRLGPSVMCGGCGKLYHPFCPSCGLAKLVRHNPKGQAYPALRCESEKCNFILSGEHIATRYTELLRAPSKPCCSKGPNAQQGTLVNFVDREAVVMELLNTKLTQFHQQRSRVFARLGERYHIPELGARSPSGGGPKLSSDWLSDSAANDPAVVLSAKVKLLEKVRLMVQLAESIAWLHGEKKIIHKDLAPDNIMISLRRVEREDAEEPQHTHPETLEEALHNLASHESFTAKVIDFGLADQHQLSRNWYEEPVNFLFAANEKLPYLSSESRNRKIKLNQRIEFELKNKRFRVPDNLIPPKAGELALMPNDILADERDPQHHYYVVVSEVIEHPEGSGQYWACFADNPPPNAHTRQYDLIRPLGEAHDIYALGAIFYYILTEEHAEVEKIGHLAGSLQYTPQKLEPDSLSRTQPLYSFCRRRLPEPHYQDDLLILILRAMVRGLDDGFVRSRIERGSEPARKLLHATRRIYNRLLSDILSVSIRQQCENGERVLHEQLVKLEEQHRVLGSNYERVSTYQRAVWSALCLGLPSSAAAGWLLAHFLK